MAVNTRLTFIELRSHRLDSGCESLPIDHANGVLQVIFSTGLTIAIPKPLGAENARDVSFAAGKHEYGLERGDVLGCRKYLVTDGKGFGPD